MIDVGETSTWSEVKDRRVLREYETLPSMLDDVWQAHENGWLPISMTEEKRPDDRRSWPWNLIKKRTIYIVSYRHASR